MYLAGHKSNTMADITMCEGTGCKRKEECYRFTAKVNEHRQTYFEQVPLNADGSCPVFYGKNVTNIIKQLNEIIRNRV